MCWNYFFCRVPPQGLGSGRGLRGPNARGAPPLAGPGDYGKSWEIDTSFWRRSM